MEPTHDTRAGRWFAGIGTPTHFRWLNGIVKWLIVFNLIDGVLTLLWINLGLATEANEFMRDLAHGNGITFILVKIALNALGAIWLWRFRCRPLAVVAIFVSFVAYYFVVLYHLQFTSDLVLNLVSAD